MANKPVSARISRFFKTIYLKIFRINDTPQKIALGLGLGVFMGVLPGTGPIAALALALLFKANRASALLGSLLTNTWLSIPVFLLSIRTGAFITGVSYQDLSRDWSLLMKDFHWATLLDLGVYKILMPILAGYALISILIGIITYLLTLIAVIYSKREKAVKGQL
jgi:uncharacterized protein (DUF2062 family)